MSLTYPVPRSYGRQPRCPNTIQSGTTGPLDNTGAQVTSSPRVVDLGSLDPAVSSPAGTEGMSGSAGKGSLHRNDEVEH